MIKFIHTGDIHLGLKFKNVAFGIDKGKRRREEIWLTFVDLIRYSKENGVHLVLISGDLFESHNFTLKDINRVKDIFSLAVKQKIVITPGNHDPMDESSPYRAMDWPENVTVLGSEKLLRVDFEDIKTSVWGMGPSRNKNAVCNQLKNLEVIKGNRNILMLHGELGEKGDYPLPDLDTLKNISMDYIALGHIHKPGFVESNIAYCGSLEPLDFGETGDRGFIQGKLSDSESFKFVPFSSRTFNVLDLVLNDQMTTESIADNILKQAGNRRDKDFFRFILKGRAPIYMDTEAVESLIDRCFYHCEIIDESMPGLDLESISRDNENNILGFFIESFKSEDMNDPIIKEALYSGIYALLEGSKKL